MNDKTTFDIDAMCSILKRQGIESSEYTDCTILYSVTFEQLRNLFTDGFNTGTIELETASEQSSKEIERLNDLVAMQSEFIEKISKQKPEKPDYWSTCSQCERNENEAEELLSASSETVEAWEAEKLLPLQRQVAICADFAHDIANEIFPYPEQAVRKADEFIQRTKATAEAYDRELKADMCDWLADNPPPRSPTALWSHMELHDKASEIRATKQVKE